MDESHKPTNNNREIVAERGRAKNCKEYVIKQTYEIPKKPVGNYVDIKGCNQ